MELTIKNKLKDTNEYRAKITELFEKYSKKLGILTPAHVIVLHSAYIQGLQGSTSYHIINGATEYTIKLDEEMVCEGQINYEPSTLYSMIYHELAHIKNIELLSKIIPIEDIPQEIVEYHNIHEMEYNFGCILWGEFYAFYNQYERNSQYFNLTMEQIIYPDIDELADALSWQKKFSEENPIIESADLNKQIYICLYDICMAIAYQMVTYSDVLIQIIEKFQKKLHIDIADFILSIYTMLNRYNALYPQNFDKDTLRDIGCEMMKLYSLLNIEISFADGIILTQV